MALFSNDIYVILVQNEQDNLFIKREQSQLAALFKNFCVSARACLSHRASLNEVLKRQVAEYKLFERESLYRFGANSLTEGIIAVDLDDKVTYVNKSMARITGYTRDEMFGTYTKDLFEQIRFKYFIQELLNGKREKNKSEAYEAKIVKNNGAAYWVRITVSAFKDTGGQIVGAIASFLEITESLNVQRIIEERQKELHDLVENMYDALILVSADGKIKKINKAGELLLGYDKNESKSIDLSSLVHPEDVHRWLEYLDKLKTEGYYSGYEGRVITKDGSIKEIAVNSTAIIENGKMIGSRDIMRDISVRKDLERRREQSENKLGLIFETVLDAMVTMNQEGYIVEWNKNAEQIFGYTVEEVTGNRLSEFIIPEQYREAHEKGMKNYFASGEGPVLNQRIEITAINKDNHEFPIELAISPVKQGEKTFFSAFIRDISDRKESESQKEALLEELEDVNQELSDFAYVVSHDLKAPLRSIGSLSDWFIADYSDVLDRAGQDLLTLLKTRIVRMHGLIEGVLQYSKLGKLKNEKEEVDVSVLLAETIDLIAPPDTCTIKIDDNLPIVSYDRIRLQQIFQNLLSNAIKFLDKLRGEISIIYSEEDDFYKFEVKDNGPGIEDVYFERIFQIFQTLNAKDEYESTGIGLSIVKRIVESNGGAITVSSVYGEGSIFVFTIPKNSTNK
ncbi:PAS domain S-box protein [Bacteroidia bacterium]|nr:PAS domain S-box protein [Bacteroidia bacterium]MDC1395191.1 PAS domain S-box protein [Bacteroidia bacterium]